MSVFGQGAGHMGNLELNQETVWGPGLLTSTLCCRWVGSEVRLCEYSFRCTVGAPCKGVGGRRAGETQATAGGGQHGEGEARGLGFRQPRVGEGREDRKESLL